MYLIDLTKAYREAMPDLTLRQAQDCALQATVIAASKGKVTGQAVTSAMIDSLRCAECVKYRTGKGDECAAHPLEQGAKRLTWKERRMEYRLARRLYHLALLDRSEFGSDMCGDCTELAPCQKHISIGEGRSGFAAEAVSVDVTHCRTAVEIQPLLTVFVETVCGRIEPKGSAKLVGPQAATCKVCQARIAAMQLRYGAVITEVYTCQ